MGHKRFPKPLTQSNDVETPKEALEVIRYLTGEWLHDPATFGNWAGGCYMEAVHRLASAGMALIERSSK